MNIVKKSEILLNQCKVCTVASVTQDGYPRICVLTPLKNDGIKELWFSTGASSNKVRHFKINDKAGVTFYDDGDSVTLTGKMEIERDKKIKDSLWRDSLAKHFPDGGKNDPEYCILHFKAEKATIYIQDEFVTTDL